MIRHTDRFPWLATVLLIPVLAALIALGVWQVQRLHWKENLLRQIAAAQTAPAQSLASVLALQAAARDANYTRVSAVCPDIERTPFLRVYAIDEGQPGYRLVTFCVLQGGGPYRTILVDRGFVDQDDVTQVKLNDGRRLQAPVIGVLRLFGRPSWLTPADEPAADIWRSRNVTVMAAALHADRPAPLFLMLESPKPSGFGPKPLPVSVDLPNNHLGYAATWFGLAIALVVMYVSMLVKRRRFAGEPPGPSEPDSR